VPSNAFDRFDIRPLFLDHLRSLRRVEHGVDEDYLRPDITARMTLYGLPATLAAMSLWQDWKLTDPGSLSAGCALMAGILFTAFTQLASLRDRLEDRNEAVGDVTRRLFRETASHLLVGALAAACETALLVFASGIRDNPDQRVAEVPTAIVLAVGLYVFLLFVMAVRKMYSAYLRVFEGDRYLRQSRRPKVRLPNR
jgi:hypothetical protein